MPRHLNRHTLSFVIGSLWLLSACGAGPTGLAPTADGRDDSLVSLKADGALGYGADQVAGVLALVNDPAVSAELLDRPRARDGVGLDRRAAYGIVAARPFADLAALDAVPYVGKTAFAALRAFACDVRRLCEADLRIATWNLHQLEDDEKAIDAIATQIKALDVDVIGLQEIADPRAFWRLVEKLDGYEGSLAKPGWYTGVGLLYRDTIAHKRAETSLFEDDSNAFPRPALLFEAEIGQKKLSFIVVHLKAQVDAKSQSRRLAACQKLDAYLDARPGIAAVILGDFNDRLLDADADNIFAPFFGRPRRLSCRDAAAGPTASLLLPALSQPDRPYRHHR
jgi:hypothetical protein